ncbi:unnamed protein product [Paramecium pentaurelia]|uniref:Acyl-CoA dehydrogenase family member 11 n=1 Tax=Paramecium pentaurelia TaxID=43138 RepID=A0A8S1XAE4_9CILI|nr:unnamed protein product [Paramecium pentaurelia]
MSLQEVEKSHLLGNYLNSSSSLLVFLGVNDAQIEEVQQLAQFIYKLSFKNTNKKIVLHTKQTENLVAGHSIEKDFVIAQKLSAVNFPVTKTLFYCADQSILGVPFYATEFIEGRLFSDQILIGMTTEEKRVIYQEVAKTLAHLHSISLNYLGLGQLESQTSHYQIVNKKLYNTYKLNETKISTNIEDLLYWLPLNLPQQSELDNLCLVHGDFSLSKVLFHPTEPRILAILDWQTAQLGNAFTDLASLLAPYYIPYSNGRHNVDGWQGVERLVGAPNQQDVIKSYFNARSTQNIPDIRYQITLAILRKSIDQQILFKQTKDIKYLNNSEFLSKAGYEIVLNLTDGDPFGIKMRAANDSSLWSKWPVTDRCKSYYYRIKDFLKEEVFPIEKVVLDKSRIMPTTTQNKGFPEIEALQRKAKSLGLWNLFISDPMYGKGLTNLEYVFLSELMGLSYLAHEIFNCFAPETGNIKLLIGYGTPYQKEKYLKPLIEGECKSYFAMTEKNVSSSDPNNFKFTITPTEGGYIINGSKWFVSSAPDERVKFGIIMGKSSQDMSNPMESQSMIIVDLPNPKIKILRQVGVFSYYDVPHSYAEVEYDNVFVPKENLLGELGGAFKMAQGRLLGGRLHHCVRQIGLTRRCLDLMMSRAEQRVIFKQKLKDNAAFQERLGQVEIAFQNCRLLSLNAGLLLDSAGSKHLHTFMAVSQCKAHIPKACQKMIDQCIQAFGAEGVTEDQPLAISFRFARAIRFMDGPCEVHLRQIARFAYGNHLFNDLNNAQGYGLAKL